MLHIWSCPKTALYATASNAVLAPCADWAGLELASLICCQLVHPILNLSGQKTWNVCVLCWNRRPASFGFLETMTYISVTKGKTFKAFKVSSDETKSPLSTLELLPNVLVPSTQDWFSDEVHLAAGLESQILYQKGKTYQTPTRMTSSWILARWSDQWLGSPDYNSSIRHTYYIFWFSQLKSRWDHQMIQALILTSNGGETCSEPCRVTVIVGIWTAVLICMFGMGCVAFCELSFSRWIVTWKTCSSLWWRKHNPKWNGLPVRNDHAVRGHWKGVHNLSPPLPNMSIHNHTPPCGYGTFTQNSL